MSIDMDLFSFYIREEEGARPLTEDLRKGKTK